MTSLQATVLILAMLGSATGEINLCTKKAIDQCMAPLEKYKSLLNIAVVPTMDGATLTQHCNDYNLYAKCMEGLRSSCTAVDKHIFDGTDQAYQFLCVDGFKEYLQHQKCFQNTALHREGKACNTTLNDKLRSIGYYRNQSVSNSFIRDRICQYAEDYFDCVDNAVSSFCGTSAAQWQRTMDEKSLGPLMENLGCPGRGPEQKTWPMAVVGVLVALTFMIIFIAVVVILVARKKKQRPRNAASVATDLYPSGSPPPYDAAYVGGHVILGGAQGGGGEVAGQLPDKQHPPTYEAAGAGGLTGAYPGGIGSPAAASSPTSAPPYTPPAEGPYSPGGARSPDQTSGFTNVGFASDEPTSDQPDGGAVAYSPPVEGNASADEPTEHRDNIPIYRST